MTVMSLVVGDKPECGTKTASYFNFNRTFPIARVK